MAIEKNSFKVSSRFDSEFSPRSRESMSSEEEDLQRRSSGAIESDDDDDEEFDDCDSGAGSDDFDLLELGESGEEFCQVEDQTCSIPFELYDLSGLGDVLSVDVWNEVLTDEERYSLAQYLPDMDQETFMRTLKELLTGCNLHFGSPLDKLFGMLKGGLCEPRVALYRQGLSFFQKHQHYHQLRKHQNSMVGNLYQIRDAWINCKGYSIQEKLRVLNIVKNEKSLRNEMEEMDSDASEREDSGDELWVKKTKDRKLGQKMVPYSLHGTSATHSRGRHVPLEPMKHQKKNNKSALKLAGPKTSASKEMKAGSYNPVMPLSRHIKADWMEDEFTGDDEEDGMYEVAVQRERKFSRVRGMDKSGPTRTGKKHEDLRDEEYTDSFMGLSIPSKSDLYHFSRNRAINQLSDIKVLTAKPSNARTPHDYGKKPKYAENIQQFPAEDQMKYGKGRIPYMPPKGSRMEFLDGSEPFWLGKTTGDPFSSDPSFRYDDRNIKNKKWKQVRDSPEPKANDRLFNPENRAKSLQEKLRLTSSQNGGRAKGIKAFAKNDETESDSSEQGDEDEDDNPLMRSKWAYPSGLPGKRSGPDLRKTKFAKKDRKDIAQALEGSSHLPRKMNELVGQLRPLNVGNLTSRVEQKGRTGQLNISSSRDLDNQYFLGPSRLAEDEDQQPIFKLGKNGRPLGDHGERFHIPMLMERRQKAEVGGEYGSSRSMYLQEDDLGEEDNSMWARSLIKDNGVADRFGKKGAIGTLVGDHNERPDLHLTGCNSVKKRKGRDEFAYIDEQDENYLHSDAHLQLDESISSKKRGKKKMDNDADILDKGASGAPPLEVAEEDIEPETRPQKKPFTLITPTVHTGFSFSIIHLLSAVRMVMITLLPEDSLEVGKHLDKNDGWRKLEEPGVKKEGSNGVHSQADLDVSNSLPSAQVNVPPLTVQEIVNRVRSNPGDPCILETQEPLQDLIRGVLKIFSSKTAPLGAKGWKPLVVYEKPTKSWSWTGPIHHNSSDHEAIEEVTSPEAWGLPHKMLVKLVDSFANWLKNGQETLQQIGSLPAPPSSLMQYNLDDKERFRDLRAQKSLSTISPSSEEVRSYFRQEEVLRYSIPDRAFSYTALDGRKSIVAPLRRCGGKPTSKARDHFMLKRDRPPHVTILCLVRDAAARLPGSIGTRADVCTLIRDSQYVVEDVSDAQVNQVVSGALDRLHYERDPCVQFDGERKLWVYLHREREEEDFEDDGTSSTKKWKRQKKEAAETFDQGAVTVAYHGPGETPGIDLSSDLIVDPSCINDDKRPDTVYDDGVDNAEENVETSHGSEHGASHHDPSPMSWDALNSMHENKLLCQENSTNEDFDDDT